MARNQHEMRAGVLLAAAGLGAALMFILDPARGARRRALARDRAGSAFRSGSEEFRRRAEDARNRVAGAVAGARSRIQDDEPSNPQLVARVRAELGHHTERAGTIDVMADDGIVTLRGQVLAEEVTSVLGTARRVRGVRDVRDELVVRDDLPAGGLPGTASGRRTEATDG